MIKHKDHFHGSDLEKIEAIYHIKKEDIVSFSANVNPLGISPRLRNELAAHIDAISSYPDREYTGLKAAISSYCGADPSNILIGNGTSELISLFIGVIRPKRALIIGPTYSEYEREISLIGGKIHYYPLQESDQYLLDVPSFLHRITDKLDLVVICNPNNPTGTAVNAKDMRLILDACKQHHTYVLVDETYIEFTEPEETATSSSSNSPESPNGLYQETNWDQAHSHIDASASISSVPLCRDYNNIIVLRGTSKFFAAPGLRLGYAILGNDDLLDHILRKKSPWMVSSLAEVAGSIMFRDYDYIKKTRTLIAQERSRLYTLFEQSDRFRPYRPKANFMLIQILDESLNSHILFEKTIREGMMIRDCRTFPFLNDRFIRICFMNPDDNDRLFTCLNS